MILSCLDFLEDGQQPSGLTQIERVAFSCFLPDLQESLAAYQQRVTARTGRNRAISNEAERETEAEAEVEEKKDSSLRKNEAASPPRASRFTPPTLNEVAAYCEERGNHIDPQAFLDFYEARSWMSGRTKIRDWRACVRTWERRERDGASASGRGNRRTVPSDEDYMEGVDL